MMTWRCVVRGGCGLLAAVLLAGCSEKPAWEVSYPAAGLLTFRGRPVPNADIVLFPEDSTWPETVRPRARTKEDGTFEVWTSEPGDGAPAGSYKVTLVRTEVGFSKGAVVAKPNDLPRKYERPDSSDLRVTIAPGESKVLAISL
ncbi:MAG TPA: hypothetical protein DC058_01635 [Planctomycetaceae bacterium]|nr:hypothetical protein [Planctomycetaceae bacterium]HBC59903.1 hypothetical protein [Planctomycetaceae bacterium]